METNQKKISQMADSLITEFLIRSRKILKDSGAKPTDENMQFVFDRLYVLEGSMLNAAKNLPTNNENDDGEEDRLINLED